MKMNHGQGLVQTGLAMGILLILATVWAFAGQNPTGPTISARYLQPRGEQITWQIRIPAPAPAAVLVTQYILPGTEILASSHPLSSYDKEKGVAKWLLSPVVPGILRMEMKLSRPIRAKGEIHGEVMFQDAGHNTTASIFMEPKTVKKALEGC